MPSEKNTARTGAKALLRRLLLIGVLVFVGFYIVFWFAQTPMIFHGERELTGDPGVYGWEFEEVTLPVGRHATHGWFVPVENARGTVLFSHGNDGNISTRLGEVGLFRSLGFSTFLYDYGGFGKSTGGPSEKRVYADTLAAWSYLTEERGIAPETIVLWGRSFGGGVTCDLARQVVPGAIILESTFTSMADAAFRSYPWFPVRLFLRHRFENKDKVGGFRAPLLVIHSRDDTLYPFERGRTLYDLAPEPKQFLEISGDHYDGAYVSKEAYERGVRDFLDPVFPSKVEE